MNRRSVSGWRRINKREARRRYMAGQTLRVCPVKLSPVDALGRYRDINNTIRMHFTDGFQDVAARKDFDGAIKCFEYYICNYHDRGRYAAFYVMS